MSTSVNDDAMNEKPAATTGESQGELHSAASSTPANDDSDERSRLQDEIVAAADVLKQDARVLPFAPAPVPAAPRPADDIFRMAAVRHGLQEVSERGAWNPGLGPFVMPPPPANKGSAFDLASVIKLGAAMGIAAGVALTVVNILSQRTSPIAARQTAEATEALPTAVLDTLTQIRAAQAKAQPEDIAAPAPLSTASIDVTPAPPPSPPAVVAALPPPPAAAPVREAAPAPAPAPQVARPTPLSRDEVDNLMKRARNLLTMGDIASARLILTRLSDHGEADASLLLAGLYDAAELARTRIPGAVPDAAKAKSWYARAVEQGSLEADRRLRLSAER